MVLPFFAAQATFKQHAPKRVDPLQRYVAGELQANHIVSDVVWNMLIKIGACMSKMGKMNEGSLERLQNQQSPSLPSSADQIAGFDLGVQQAVDVTKFLGFSSILYDNFNIKCADYGIKNGVQSSHAWVVVVFQGRAESEVQPLVQVYGEGGTEYTPRRAREQQIAREHMQPVAAADEVAHEDSIRVAELMPTPTDYAQIDTRHLARIDVLLQLRHHSAGNLEVLDDEEEKSGGSSSGSGGDGSGDGGGSGGGGGGSATEPAAAVPRIKMEHGDQLPARSTETDFAKSFWINQDVIVESGGGEPAHSTRRSTAASTKAAAVAAEAAESRANIAAADDAVSREGEKMFDNMNFANLLKNDLNAEATNVGLLDFIVAQYKRATHGLPPNSCTIQKTGAYMVGDGSPIAMGIRVQEKFPKKYWMVHFICGGFHTYKNMWGKLGRTVRAPLLRSIYAGYRDNDRQLEYVSSPSDPRDCKDEAAIIESSRIFDVADAYESQPSYIENPEPYTAIDLLQFWYERAKVCTLAYFSLLESRSVELPLTMEHCGRSGTSAENFALYNSMEAVSVPVLTTSNSNNYMKITTYNRLERCIESSLQRALARTYAFVQKTSSGRWTFSDEFVENIMNRIRKRFGHVHRAGIDKQIADFILRIAGDYNRKTGFAQALLEKIGTVPVTRLFDSASANFKRHNIHGHGGLSTCVSVKNPAAQSTGQSALIDVNPATLVTPDGSQISEAAIDCMVLGTQRAIDHFGRVLGGMQRVPKEFAAVEFLVGNAAELAYLKLVKATTSSAFAIHEKGGLFTADDIVQELVAAKADNGVKNEAGELVCNDAVTTILARLADVNASGRIPRLPSGKAALAKLLAEIRKAAGLKVPDRKMADAKQEIAKSWPTADSSKHEAAHAHPMFKNSLLLDVALKAKLFCVPYGGAKAAAALGEEQAAAAAKKESARKLERQADTIDDASLLEAMAADDAQAEREAMMAQPRNLRSGHSRD